MDCQIRTNNSKGNDSKYRGRRKTFKTRKQKRLESQNRKDDRDTNPRKNAYADIVKKNKDFEFYYKQQNIVESESEWNEFLEILQKPLPSAFRISSFCAGQARKMRDIIEGDYIQKFFLENGTEPSQDLQIFPLPWYPNKLAWTMNLSKVEIRKSPTLNKFHQFLISETETGDISRQEAVSMIPPLLLDIKAGQTVLDLCAAPGSKTAQIIEMLHQETSSTFLTENERCSTNKILDGLVVANDVDNRRCYMLVHQSKRLHSPCVVITNHDAATLPNFYTVNDTILKFDRVLADVPCSGDGTFRKNYEVWSKWNAGNSNNLHYLQSKIAKRGVELLKKDGIMAYSTCSLNPIENEAVIAALLNSAPGDLELINTAQLLPELKRRPGLETWSVMTKDCKMFKTHQEVPENLRSQLRETLFPPTNVSELNLKYCMRIMPHYQNTGGFFIALVRKKVDRMCWEPKDQATTNDDQNQNQKPAQQQRQQNNNSKKKKRFMGHREDPFFFLNETDPDWLSLKSYYCFPDNFNVNQLAHRCSKGKRRNIYYLTEKAADFIKNNPNVKLITGGARVFNRLEVKVLSCPYRITQEGIPSMFAYFVLDLDKYSPCSGDGASQKDGEPEDSHLKIIEFDFEHYVRLLQQEGLKTEELSDDVKTLMAKIPTGCCIFYVRINYLNDDGGNESKFILPICVWKEKNSIRAYVAKNDRIHLLRLCGHEPATMMSVTVNGDQEETDDHNRRTLDDDDDDDQSTEKSQKRPKLAAEESNDNNQTAKEDHVC